MSTTFTLTSSGAVVRVISAGDRSALEDLCRAVQVTGIEPVIDRVFEFGSANGIFEHLRSGRHIGKSVIKVTA